MESRILICLLVAFRYSSEFQVRFYSFLLFLAAFGLLRCGSGPFKGFSKDLGVANVATVVFYHCIWHSLLFLPVYL